ncbi:hypothetical protein [Prosthecobacter sp.]|uniref:hypothetical protein n=1 Tax=Prosthecobacter sp. TaxID=1965333 RepID=UPI002ABB5F36|nr:hypothetical protein [Prosthecobacter sp.]MDZ4405637.1 hypothetical protein [Prosthecobacter sp.]
MPRETNSKPSADTPEGGGQASSSGKKATVGRAGKASGASPLLTPCLPSDIKADQVPPGMMADLIGSWLDDMKKRRKIDRAKYIVKVTFLALAGVLTAMTSIYLRGFFLGNKAEPAAKPQEHRATQPHLDEARPFIWIFGKDQMPPTQKQMLVPPRSFPEPPKPPAIP